MSMFEIIRAQGVGNTEAIEPGRSVEVRSGDRIICDQVFTEVTSITRIDDNLYLIIDGNPPCLLNQFFSAQNALMKFADKQISSDELTNLLQVQLTSTDIDGNNHSISLLPGSVISVDPGENFYLDSEKFDIKDLHRHGLDLIIQSHDESANVIAVLNEFFKKLESGEMAPQLHIITPSGDISEEMLVHPHSNIFQWEGEPLPTAVIGSLYGYYFELKGADADKFVLVAKTSEGELPRWMSFSRIEGGKYYLAGIPTTAHAGTTEVVIDAYSIQNRIGFHTQQTFELQIKSIDDTTTRPNTADIATAEFRSLNQTVIADQFVTGILTIDQMPYMSMPEIAVITSLAAINPMTLNQAFSSSLTPAQILGAKESGQNNIMYDQGVINDSLIKKVFLNSHAEVPATQVEHGLPAIQIVTEPTASTTTGTTEPTTQPTPQTQTTPIETSPPATTTSDITPQMLISPPAGTTPSTHYLLTLQNVPPPPPPPGPLFIDLSQPFNGFEFHGQGSYAYSGIDATIVRDMTGDGLGDLVVGAYLGSTGYGSLYLVPGKTTPFPSQFDITEGSVNGSNFTVTSPSVYLYTYHVAAVGDFNGDGLDDILVTGNGSSKYYSFYHSFAFKDAKAYIIFGNPGGFAPNVDISALVSSGGAVEFSVVNTYSGIVTYGFTNTNYLGDVNGDGLADVIISDYKRVGFNTDTNAYVLFGTSTPSNHINLSMLDGTDGFQLTPAVNQPSFLGMTGVDINGDGFNDVFLNTYRTTPYNNQVTVTFGKSTGFTPTVDPTSLPVGDGFIIYDSLSNDSLYRGFGVRNSVNIGDVNHDGIDDVLIVQKNEGNAYVVFGDPNFSSVSTFDVATLNGSNGFKLTSTVYDYITQMAYLGDVNGDGLPDFIVADASAYDGKGAAHIIFGSATGFPAVIDLHNLTRDQGFTVIGAEPYTWLYSVAGGGDLNGDGLADIVVSGRYINNGQGVSYVIFGDNFNNHITLMGTSAGETLNGTAGNDVIYGAGGSDTINALGGNDFIDALGNSRIYAGQGNDTIVYYRDDAPVQGGTGTDTLWFKYDNTHVTFIGATNYAGIDEINLQPMRSLVGNSVTLDAATVLSMSDANLMTINGNAHDIATLIATDFWTPSSVLAGYTTYTSMSGSVVNVQDGVHVTFAPPPTPVALNFTLSTLIDGMHGFSLTSTADFYATNATIMQNGDGFDDLLVGARRDFSYTNYINAIQIHGQALFNASTPLIDPSLSESLFKNDTVNTPQNFFNLDTVSVGDFNGDGIHDFVLSTFYGYPPILVLGQPSGFPSNVQISALGGSAVQIVSSSYYSNTVGAAGDVNGDGLSDIIANGTQWAGVFFGTTTPGTAIDAQSFNGTDGFNIYKGSLYTTFEGVGGADITGDGFNETFVSIYDQSSHQGGLGVIFGNSVFNTNVHLDLSGVYNASGFIITDPSLPSGYSNHLVNLTDIGNFNGSGIDSIAMSSKHKVYVLFGDQSLASATSFDLTTLNGSNGFTLEGVGGDYPSIIKSIAYLGDVNGDGLADFGFVDGNSYSGFSGIYVIFGSTDPMPAVIDFTNLNSNQGFAITDPSINLSYASIGGGGDLNGDGLSDIVITNNGTEYVVFGNNFNGAITQIGLDTQNVIQGVGNHDVIYGTSGNDNIIGGPGDSFISGGAGADVINGGTGNNTIVYDAFDTTVYGGIGNSNTLWLQNDNIHVNFIGNTVFTGFNIINLQPMQTLVGNSVTLDATAVNTISNGNIITINGNAHDVVTLSASDLWAPSSVIPGYATYTSLSGSVVNVENGVRVTFAPLASPIPLSFEISSLTNGVHGFELTNTFLLHATSATIVQNGDGFGDLLIANGFSAGFSPYIRAFIVDGQPAFGASLPFDDLSLTTSTFNNNSFAVPIAAYGQHVNSIGDFNGDGIKDILISEFYGGNGHIILGQPLGFPATSLISSIGIELTGNNENTSAALGDVNGDGLSDIALSDSQTGWGAVIFGTTTPGSSIDTSTLTGTDGFQIARPGSSIIAGLQDVGTVDLTGDGKNDILVSFYDTTTHIGSIGVILGNTPVFSSTVSISSSGISGANGFLISNNGGTPGVADYLVNPTDIGNFNASGVDSFAFSSQNSVYVVFGNTLFNTSSNFDVSSLNGTNGFELTASGVHNIINIAYLGDVNGDGLPDFGFFDGAAYSGQGAVYVIFGSNTVFSSGSIDFTALNSDQGFVITNPSVFGYNQTVAGILGVATVSGGGDLNGDGLGDIVITSRSNEYIVYGQNFNGAITQMGTPGNDTIIGTQNNEIIYGGAGDDTITALGGNNFINGGAGNDIINGGSGNDTIVYDSHDSSLFGVDGGSGTNTLWFENDGTLADLQNTTIFKDFDVINLKPLQSLTGNSVELDPQGVMNMSHNNTLQIDMGAHDSLVLHNSGADVWSLAAINVNIGGNLYTEYSSSVTNSIVYAENTPTNHVTIV